MANSYSSSTSMSAATSHQSQSEFARWQMLWNETMDLRVKPVKHDKTFVLCLTWDPDATDIRSGPEVDRLRAVLENDYHFEVIHEMINTQSRPQYQISEILSRFMRLYDSKHHLLIIYYAGHGWNEKDTGDLKLLGTTTRKEWDEAEANAIAWTKAETIIRDTYADVLVIFDCCHAGALGRTRSSERCFEFLGACGAEETTRMPGRESFTTALIWALTELAKEKKYFPTSELLRMIKKYQYFPEHQYPLLVQRFESNSEFITIAPMVEKNSSVEAVGEYRENTDPIDLDCLDLRFHYKHRLDDNRVRQTCEALSRLIKDDSNHMSATRISFKGKVSPAADIVKLMKERIQRKRGSSFENPSIPNEQPLILDTNVQTYLEIPVVLTPADDSSRYMLTERHPLLSNGTPPLEQNHEIGGIGYHFRMLFTYLLERFLVVIAIFIAWFRPSLKSREGNETLV